MVLRTLALWTLSMPVPLSTEKKNDEALAQLTANLKGQFPAALICFYPFQG